MWAPENRVFCVETYITQLSFSYLLLCLLHVTIFGCNVTEANNVIHTCFRYVRSKASLSVQDTAGYLQSIYHLSI